MESGAQSTVPIGLTSTTWQGPYESSYSPFAPVAMGRRRGIRALFGCLKALPAQQLLQAQMMTEALPLHSTGSIALNKWSKKADSIQIRFRGAVHSDGDFVLLTHRAPSVDRQLTPDSPHTFLAQGKLAKIPFITGNSLDE